MVKSIANMIGEIRDAFLTPDAPLLPAAFAAVGMLVGDDWFIDSVRVPNRVEDLDVTGINLLAPPGVSMPGPIRVDRPLSAATTLAAFDLTATDASTTARSTVEIEATESGIATGIVQWVRHSFPDGSVYESRPDLACNWWPFFWPFPQPLPLRRGDRVESAVETTPTEVFIDLVTSHGG